MTQNSLRSTTAILNIFQHGDRQTNSHIKLPIKTKQDLTCHL